MRCAGGPELGWVKVQVHAALVSNEGSQCCTALLRHSAWC